MSKMGHFWLGVTELQLLGFICLLNFVWFFGQGVMRPWLATTRYTAEEDLELLILLTANSQVLSLQAWTSWCW